MIKFGAVLAFLRSKTLTVWLVGIFLINYISVAVWSKEAFATLVSNLSTNNLFRGLYILFFLNVSFRTIRALRDLLPHRLAFVLRLPLYAGFLIFLFSFFMSLNFRQQDQVVLGEGHMMKLPWENSAFRASSLVPAFKKRALRTDDSAIFDYEPGVTLEDKDGIRYAVKAFPPMLVHSSFMHVLNFGLAPSVELRRNNEVVSQGQLALRLTPFGKADSFEMSPYPYTFSLSIQPNRIIKKGKESARDYDLARPLYQVEISKGETIIARAETDTAISFDGNMSLRFFPPGDWVLLEVARDPFLVGFVAGLLLLVFGAVLYPFSFLGG